MLIQAFKQNALTCQLECQEAREYDPAEGNWSLISPLKFPQAKRRISMESFMHAQEKSKALVCASPRVFSMNRLL